NRSRPKGRGMPAAIHSIGAAASIFELVARAPGDAVHRAGEAVAAVEGALRATHHLDALQPVEADVNAAEARRIDAVHKDRHVGFVTHAGVLRQAADDRTLGRDARRFREYYARGLGRQAREVLDAAVVQGFTGESGDRNRDGLQGLDPVTGRDDDL